MATKRRNIANEVSSYHICIDHYEEDIPKGRIYCTLVRETIIFNSWISMIKKLDSLMEHNDFPQASMQLRSFQSKEGKMCEIDPKEKKKDIIQVTNDLLRGSLATFKLRILYRQNATWQGVLYWKENGKEERFRSVLELITLIDSCFHQEIKQSILNKTQEKSVI